MYSVLSGPRAIAGGCGTAFGGAAEAVCCHNTLFKALSAQPTTLPALLRLAKVVKFPGAFVAQLLHGVSDSLRPARHGRAIVLFGGV